MFLSARGLFIIVISICEAYEDLSYEKLATQSTTVTGGLYNASNAVDGNETTCMRTQAMGLNSTYKSVWWKVDLGGEYNIQEVTILFKNYDSHEMRQRGRFAGFRIYASITGEINGSSLCYKDESQLPTLNFTTTCTASGRYVIFYNERLDGVTYPEGYEVSMSFPTELCEVIVKGCRNLSVFGVDCNEPCPINCKYNKCDIQNGDCFECEPGWNGDDCTLKCHGGWFGKNCAQLCASHCRYSFCDHVTGRCDEGCAAGWTGSFCNETCVDGTFGIDCLHNCSSHCLNDSLCDKGTGYCDMGCNPGYTSKNCTEDCPFGYFGNDCKSECSANCLNNSLCDHINGACLSGCKDGYEGTHCNAVCSEGLYGRNCSEVCSSNCSTCHPINGCICDAGWMGSNCSEECLIGYFGDGCKNECSKNCLHSAICDHVDGGCLGGCQNGYKGKQCKDFQDNGQGNTK